MNLYWINLHHIIHFFWLFWTTKLQFHVFFQHSYSKEHHNWVGKDKVFDQQQVFLGNCSVPVHWVDDIWFYTFKILLFQFFYHHKDFPVAFKSMKVDIFVLNHVHDDGFEWITGESPEHLVRISKSLKNLLSFCTEKESCDAWSTFNNLMMIFELVACERTSLSRSWKSILHNSPLCKAWSDLQGFGIKKNSSCSLFYKH